MKVYETSSLSEAVRLAEEWNEERCIVHISTEPCVLTGQLLTLNRNECNRRGLEIGQAVYLGGSIVNMLGDLSICIITWGNSDIAQNIVDCAAKWLVERGISVLRDGNDVLADGKKVISWAMATTLSGWCQSVVHFSIGPMDMGLVQAICTKPMEKVPGSLGDHKITAEEIYSAVVEPLIKGD